MEKAGSQTKVIGSFVSGLLRIIGGGVGLLVFGIFLIISTVNNWGAPIVVFLLATMGSGLLLSGGISACSLSSTAQKIQGRLQGNDRESLATLAKLTHQSLTALVRDLRCLIRRGYFPGAYVDLERREFVVKESSSLPPILLGPTVLREVSKSSVLPVYLLALTWVAYILLLPMYRWMDLAMAAVLSVVVYMLSRRIIPGYIVIVEEPRKVEPPPKPVTINTGDPELDEALTAAMGYMKQLTALETATENRPIHGSVQQLVGICRQMFDYIKKTPQKVRQTRQFMNYYLPTTIKLLQSYDELSREPVKGDNIRGVMTKIEDNMATIVDAFQRELNNLYQDKALDISVDIEVLQNMMGQNNLSDLGELVRKDQR